ncbi:hypothetical protein PA598K_07228, partial [Paenibacillus sp. 598K]
ETFVRASEAGQMRPASVRVRAISTGAHPLPLLPSLV